MLPSQKWLLFVCLKLVLHLWAFIIIILHGLGRLTCSGIDAMPSFPGAFIMRNLFLSSTFIVAACRLKFTSAYTCKYVTTTTTTNNK